LASKWQSTNRKAELRRAASSRCDEGRRHKARPVNNRGRRGAGRRGAVPGAAAAQLAQGRPVMLQVETLRTGQPGPDAATARRERGAKNRKTPGLSSASC